MTDSHDSNATETPKCGRCGSAEVGIAFSTPHLTYLRCHGCGHLWTQEREPESQKGRRRSDER